MKLASPKDRFPHPTTWSRADAIDAFGVGYVHAGPWRTPIVEVLGTRPPDPHSHAVCLPTEAAAVAHVRQAARDEAEREIQRIEGILNAPSMRTRLALARNFRALRRKGIGILATESIFDHRRKECRAVLRNGISPEVRRLPDPVRLPIVLPVGLPAYVLDTRRFPDEPLRIRKDAIARRHLVDAPEHPDFDTLVRYELAGTPGYLSYDLPSIGRATLEGLPPGMDAFLNESLAEERAEAYADAVRAKLGGQAVPYARSPLPAASSPALALVPAPFPPPVSVPAAVEPRPPVATPATEPAPAVADTPPADPNTPTVDLAKPTPLQPNAEVPSPGLTPVTPIIGPEIQARPEAGPESGQDEGLMAGPVPVDTHVNQEVLPATASQEAETREEPGTGPEPDGPSAEGADVASVADETSLDEPVPLPHDAGQPGHHADTSAPGAPEVTSAAPGLSHDADARVEPEAVASVPGDIPAPSATDVEDTGHASPPEETPTIVTATEAPVVSEPPLPPVVPPVEATPVLPPPPEPAVLAKAAPTPAPSDAPSAFATLGDDVPPGILGGPSESDVADAAVRVAMALCPAPPVNVAVAATREVSVDARPHPDPTPSPSLDDIVGAAPEPDRDAAVEATFFPLPAVDPDERPSPPPARGPGALRRLAGRAFGLVRPRGRDGAGPQAAVLAAGEPGTATAAVPPPSESVPPGPSVPALGPSAPTAPTQRSPEVEGMILSALEQALALDAAAPAPWIENVEPEPEPPGPDMAETARAADAAPFPETRAFLSQGGLALTMPSGHAPSGSLALRAIEAVTGRGPRMTDDVAAAA